MGVIIGALAALAVVALAAVLVMFIERRLYRVLRPGLAAEPGPAARVTSEGDVNPSAHDPWLYLSSPPLTLLGVSWALVAIPLGRHPAGSDAHAGLFYFAVVLGFVALGLALGAWGANTPLSVEACYRTIAQWLAGFVPFSLAIAAPAMMAGSLSSAEIIRAQSAAGAWYVFLQPLSFALFVASSLIQTYRAPFLEPFAANVGYGLLSVYGGWRAAFHRLALSALLFLVAAMGAVLFLGGDSGPGMPRPAWLLLKTLSMILLFAAVGARLPLLSTARMLRISWMVLVPVGLLNLLLVAALTATGIGRPQ